MHCTVGLTGIPLASRGPREEAVVAVRTVFTDSKHSQLMDQLEMHELAMNDHHEPLGCLTSSSSWIEASHSNGCQPKLAF